MRELGGWRDVGCCESDVGVGVVGGHTRGRELLSQSVGVQESPVVLGVRRREESGRWHRSYGQTPQKNGAKVTLCLLGREL